MTIEPKVFKAKNGISVEYSCAWPEEAQDLMDCLRTCCGETRFLLNDADEINFTLEEEENFINTMNASPWSLLVNAYADGKLVGDASFSPVGSSPRLAHRCSVGIALLKDYCGIGIGTELMQIMIENARRAGYEMMELDAVSTNAAAIALYEKCGFKKYGELPHAFRYRDGSYADLIYMVLNL